MSTNWSGNVALNGKADTLWPSSPQHLQSLLTNIVQNRGRARGLGGQYSTSHVMAPASQGKTISATGLLLDRKPGEPVPPKVAPLAQRGPARWYRSNTAGLVQISAGARIDDVNRYLTVQERSLPMMGAFSGQTFVGAMLTGTHGTGAGIGPLADLVVSMDVVTVDHGRVVRYRIERADGPTHAQNYEADTGRRVFHDDDLFAAFSVSMGYLGIVTSVVARTLPLFRLRQAGEIIPWDEVTRRLTDAGPDGVPRRAKDAYGLTVIMNPYRDSAGKWPTCLWNELHLTTDPVTPAPPDSMPAQTAALLPQVLRLDGPDGIPTGVDRVVRATKVANRVDIAHKILTSPKPFALKGYGLEFGFPVHPDGKYLDAVKAFLKKIAIWETQSSPQWLAGFFTLRFVKGSSAYLAQSYDPAGGVTCTLEVLAAKDLASPDLILPSLVDVGLEHGGRAHWGQLFDVSDKLNALSAANIRKAFASHPGYPKWKPHYDRFNALGTFSNQVGELLP